jgi:hypothetical protein
VQKVIEAVFGSIESEDIVTAPQVMQRMGVYLEEYLDEVKVHLDARHDLSENPIAVLRRILSRVGIALKGEQIMRDGVRYMAYQLDKDSIDTMMVYALSRQQHLKWKITTNTGYSLYLTREHSNQLPLFDLPESEVAHGGRQYTPQ